MEIIFSPKKATAQVLLLFSISLSSFFIPVDSYPQTSCSKVFTSSFYKKIAPSRSGLNPVFRLPHVQFVEKNNDGASYVNPSQTAWSVFDGEGHVDINTEKPSAKSPESLVRLKGSIRGKDLLLEAKEKFGGNDLFFSNPEYSWGHSTHLRLRASSVDPNQIFTLIIGNGKNPLRLPFKPSQEPEDIVIPIPEGAFTNLSEFSIPFFIEVKAKNTRSFELNLFGPIIFERNIYDPQSKALDYLMRQLKNEILHLPSLKMIQEIMSLAIQNLANPIFQERALRISDLGDDAVLTELMKIGFTYEYELNDKTTTENFFLRSHNVLSETLVPVEVGTFSKEHGRNSHGLQLIAMTSGMTEEQVRVFIEHIYRPTFSTRSARWAAWDILFDSPGDRFPNSPLWWRKQVENRGK